MEGFGEIAKYLTHPLVLVGYVVALVVGVHRALLKGGYIPPLSQRAGGKILRILLHYGFIIALVVIILGFALEFYRTHNDQDPTRMRIRGLADAASGFCRRDFSNLSVSIQEDQVRACSGAIDALTDSPVAPQRIEEALAQLAGGHGEQARAIFKEIYDRESAAGHNGAAAEAARHLGALAFSSDTDAALDAYQNAVRLDPGNPEGWNQLGGLLLRVGRLDEAEAAFRHVEAIGEATKNRALMAAATTNLGSEIEQRGDIVGAERLFEQVLQMSGIQLPNGADDADAAKTLQQTLDRNKASGNAAEIADAETNLALLYESQGDLSKAEQIETEALGIDEGLGRNDAVAILSANLAHLNLTRGDLQQSEGLYQKAIELDEKLGANIALADAYASLSLVYGQEDKPKDAFDVLGKALALDASLNRKPGLADAYSNLGIAFAQRGDLANAEAFQTKALELDEGMGRKDGAASDLNNLGLVYLQRGALERAHTMFEKALQMDTDLGRKEYMGNDMADLGLLYQKYGDHPRAEEMYLTAIELYDGAGAKGSAARVQHFLDKMPRHNVHPLAMLPVARGTGDIPQSPDDITTGQISRYQQGIRWGCERGIGQSGGTINQADKVCHCITGYLHHHVTAGEWREAVFYNQQQRSDKEKAILGPALAATGCNATH